MKGVRLLGLGVTLAAVLALLISLLAGLGDSAPLPAGERVEAGGATAVTRRGRVEVLNAAGRPGLARAGTWQLRERGFDVVAFGNAAGFGRDSSLVLARTGDLRLAQQVADAIGVERVRVEADTTLLVDVTVVLGADWDAEGVPLPWRPAPTGVP